VNPYQETLLRAHDAARAEDIRRLDVLGPGGEGPTSERAVIRFASVVRQPRATLRHWLATVGDRFRSRLTVAVRRASGRSETTPVRTPETARSLNEVPEGPLSRLG
jgi:hypothetical protein